MRVEEIPLRTWSEAKTMDKRDHFSDGVAAKLQHYFYRLIDPRNGSTFYVGRGQGDRIFAHAAGQQKASDPEDTCRCFSGSCRMSARRSAARPGSPLDETTTQKGGWT